MANITKYKADASVKKEIEDILNSLLNVCKINQIPMYATVAVENNEENTEYSTVICNPASRDIMLINDEVRKHMLIGAGFKINKNSDEEDAKKEIEYMVIMSNNSKKSDKLFEYVIVSQTDKNAKKIEKIISAIEKKQPKKDEKIEYNDVELTDDRIKRHIQVDNGADVIFPRESVVFDPFALIGDIEL